MPGLVPKEDERSNSMKIILPDGSVQEAEDELRAIRHTASHVLAQAVKRLYPETKLASRHNMRRKTLKNNLANQMNW